jgi:hypothetical protein
MEVESDKEGRIRLNEEGKEERQQKKDCTKMP